MGQTRESMLMLLPVGSPLTPRGENDHATISAYLAELSRSILFLLLAVVATAGIVTARTTFSDLEVGFWSVAAWQLVSWLPWFVLVPALVVSVTRTESGPLKQRFSSHVVRSLLASALSTAWFCAVSSTLSPFLDQPSTRFGVFPWFFIFWALASFLGYWSVVGFALMAGPNPRASDEPHTKGRQHDDVGQAPQVPRMFVEVQGTLHVVPHSDIDWIEAQDYYVVVHAGRKTLWVKRSMDELERALDPDEFLRIHRSTLVRLDRIERVERDETGQPYAVLRDGVRRRFSQARWQAFRRQALSRV